MEVCCGGAEARRLVRTGTTSTDRCSSLTGPVALSTERMQLSRTSLLFFFQAEDGIRDYKVTGVQTCALPIYDAAPGCAVELGQHQSRHAHRLLKLLRLGERVLSLIGVEHQQHLVGSARVDEIGRASCRERV